MVLQVAPAVRQAHQVVWLNRHRQQGTGKLKNQSKQRLRFAKMSLEGWQSWKNRTRKVRKTEVTNTYTRLKWGFYINTAVVHTQTHKNPKKVCFLNIKDASSDLPYSPRNKSRWRTYNIKLTIYRPWFMASRNWTGVFMIVFMIHKRLVGRQPKLYRPTKGQLGVLCQWQGCRSPSYKSVNCKMILILKIILR